MKKKQHNTEYKLKTILKSHEIGVAKAAVLFDVSGITVKRWRKLYKEGGEAALNNTYIPPSDPFNNKIPDDVRQAIINCRRNNPSLSGKKIIKELNLKCSAVVVYKIIKEAHLEREKEYLHKDPSILFDRMFFSMRLLRKSNPGEKNSRLYQLQLFEPEIGFCFLGFVNLLNIKSIICFLDYVVHALKQYGFDILEIQMSHNLQSVKWKKELDKLLFVRFNFDINIKSVGRIKRRLKKTFKGFDYQTDHIEELIFKTHDLMLDYNLDIVEDLSVSGLSCDSSLKHLFHVVPPIFIDDQFNSVPLLGQRRMTKKGKDAYLSAYIKFLYEQARSSYAASKNDKSLVYCKKGLRTVQYLTHKNIPAAKILIQKGLTNLLIGETDIAGQCFSESLKLGNISKDKERVAEAYYFLGYLAVAQINTEYGLECYNKALAIYKEQGNDRKICIVLNFIIELFNKQRRLEEALPLALNNVITAKKLNDYQLITLAINSLANIYMRLKFYDKAIGIYEDNLLLQQKKDDKQGIAITYSNLGLVYFELTDYAKAQQYYMEQRDLAKEINNRKLEAKAYFTIGRINDIKDRFEIAVHNYKKAHKYMQKLNNKDELVVIVEFLGKIYQKHNNPRISLGYFKEMLQLAKEIKNDFRIERTERLISEISKKL